MKIVNLIAGSGIVVEPIALCLCAATFANRGDALAFVAIGFFGWLRGIGYAVCRARAERLEGWHQ